MANTKGVRSCHGLALAVYVSIHLDFSSNRREDHFIRLINTFIHLRKMSSGNDFICVFVTGQLS